MRVLAVDQSLMSSGFALAEFPLKKDGAKSIEESIDNIKWKFWTLKRKDNLGIIPEAILIITEIRKHYPNVVILEEVKPRHITFAKPGKKAVRSDMQKITIPLSGLKHCIEYDLCVYSNIEEVHNQLVDEIDEAFGRGKAAKVIKAHRLGFDLNEDEADALCHLLVFIKKKYGMEL